MIITNYKNLQSKYNLIRKIGSGGMSDVFLVQSLKDNKYYAVKIINNDKVKKEINLKRFQEEIKILEEIYSDHVIKIIDYHFSRKDEEYYMVLEYVEGDVLKNIIERNGNLNIFTTVNYAIQIAEGMIDIHDAKIIHRDIKSSNIMVNNIDKVKIIDFGIAINDRSSKITTENKVIGSIHYMSPEILEKKHVTEKADIYAMGILIYEMLIGQTPFFSVEKDSFMDIVKKQKNQKVINVTKINPSIPNSLANIIIKATAKNEKQRYATVRLMLNDLKTCLDTNRRFEDIIDLDNKTKKWNFWDFISSKWGLITLGSIIIFSLALIVILAIVI